MEEKKDEDNEEKIEKELEGVDVEVLGEDNNKDFEDEPYPDKPKSNKSMIIIVSAIVIGIIIVVLLASAIFDIYPGISIIEEDSLGSCLTEKNAMMYGASWCGFCNRQKSEFGSDFENVLYIECTENVEACQSANVTGYPTWFINGTRMPGYKPLSVLASLAECEYGGE